MPCGPRPIAGGYLEQTRIPPAQYLALLRENPGKIVDRPPFGDSSEETIARIWRITLDRLAQEEDETEKSGAPFVLQLLRVLAWFGPESMPREVFNHLDLSGRNIMDIQERLGRLAEYNLITFTANLIVKDFGDQHKHVLETERLLATVISSQGRVDEAQEMLRSILRQ